MTNPCKFDERTVSHLQNFIKGEMGKESKLQALLIANLFEKNKSVIWNSQIASYISRCIVH